MQAFSPSTQDRAVAVYYIAGRPDHQGVDLHAADMLMLIITAGLLVWLCFSLGVLLSNHTFAFRPYGHTGPAMQQQVQQQLQHRTFSC